MKGGTLVRVILYAGLGLALAWAAAVRTALAGLVPGSVPAWALHAAPGTLFAVTAAVAVVIWWKPKFSWRSIILLQIVVLAALGTWHRRAPWVYERRIKGPMHSTESVAFSPCGNYVVVGSSAGTAHVWNVSTGGYRTGLVGHSGRVLSARFSPDGARIATGSEDGTAKVWRASDGEELFTLEGNYYLVKSVRFSPDGTRVVGVDGRQALLWDSGTGSLLRKFRDHGHIWVTFTGGGGAEWTSSRNCAYGAAFSPDSRLLVTCGADYTVRVTEIETGERLLVMAGSGTSLAGATVERKAWLDFKGGLHRCFGAAGFSPDGSHIVAGTQAGHILVWDVAGGECGRKIGYIGGQPVRWCAFSPDGKRIGAAGRYGCVRVYDASDCRKLYEFRSGERIRSADWSPDGRRIATAGVGGIRVWRRRRPEPWWGVAAMWESWLACACCAALALSLAGDRARFRAAPGPVPRPAADVPASRGRRRRRPLARRRPRGHNRRPWSSGYSTPRAPSTSRSTSPRP